MEQATEIVTREMVGARDGPAADVDAGVGDNWLRK